jgi:XRE family transcriptional regulator, regulator of sulfur utilization
MQEQRIQRGRPKGARTFDPVPAQAFGAAVREARVAQGIAQETLAGLAGIERSHMGKIERGEHIPSLPLIFKIAAALECGATDLMAATEAQLGSTAA